MHNQKSSIYASSLTEILSIFVHVVLFPILKVVEIEDSRVWVILRNQFHGILVNIAQLLRVLDIEPYISTRKPSTTTRLSNANSFRRKRGFRRRTDFDKERGFIIVIFKVHFQQFFDCHARAEWFLFKWSVNRDQPVSTQLSPDVFSEIINVHATFDGSLCGKISVAPDT